MSTVTMQRGEQHSQKIKLRHITTSHNPRKPCPNIQANGLDPLEVARNFGLSDDLDKRAEYVKMMDEFEPEIVSLAESIRGSFQIQAIRVRDFRVKIPGTDEYEVRYGIAAGERRFMASVYNFAKYGDNDTVLAVVKKMTVDEAYWMGVQENLQRREMEDWEIADIFNKWAVENGTDGQPAPITAVAAHFKRDYQYCRGRMSLAKLPTERLQALKEGKLGVTAAIKEGLGEVKASQSKPSKEGKRQIPLSIKEMKLLFDDTPAEKEEVRRVIAQCMKMEYDEAVQESNQRLNVEGPIELRKAS